eukprot:scaffold6774_cov91-Cylindrotheca_fusiformis.AAC.2
MSGKRQQTKRPAADNKNTAPPAKKKATFEEQEKATSEEQENEELRARIAALESENSTLKTENSAQDKTIAAQDKTIAALKKEKAEQESREKKRSFVTLGSLERPFTLVRDGSAFSHVYGNHQEATATEATLNLEKPKIEVLQSAECASLLLQRFVKQGSGSEIENQKRCYSSEADVCSFVRDAADDAIRILEVEGSFLPSQLRTTLERGLFSCRPDIMVVRSHTGMAYLAVEVKRPVPKNPEGEQRPLVQFPRVLGHAFDHAMAMDAFGMGTPIVIITSFEESYMCSPNRSDFEEMKVKEADETEQINGDETGESNAAPDSPKQTKSQTQSQSPPELKSPSSIMAKKEGAREIQCGFKSGLHDRSLYRSEPCESHQLVWLLYTALRIAHVKYIESLQTICKLRPDTFYHFPKLLRVVEKNEEGNNKKKKGNNKKKKGNAKKKEDNEKKKKDNKVTIDWGEATIRLGDAIPIQSSEEKTDEKTDEEHRSYYIFGILGQGTTSNVYHALDSSGKQVALKIYVNNYVENEIMSDEEFKEKAIEATSREAEYLKKMYPILKDEVKATNICGKHCVVMPFFEPIKKENRQGQLKNIKDGLEKFEQEKLQYRDQDVRWRHVGIYKDTTGQEHCILYDLSDLVKMEMTSKSLVEHHYKDFVLRMKDSEPQKKGFSAKQANAGT